MIILITDDGYLCESAEVPVVGKRYKLEDAERGTSAQNNAFHALVQEYFASGCFSQPAQNVEQLKDFIKRDLGAGFESYVYATPDGIQKAKAWTDIPPEYRNKKHAMGKLKSWSKYTKKERRETMDLLIAEMHLAGVQTQKFYAILEGMEGLWQKEH